MANFWHASSTIEEAVQNSVPLNIFLDVLKENNYCKVMSAHRADLLEDRDAPIPDLEREVEKLKGAEWVYSNHRISPDIDYESGLKSAKVSATYRFLN